MSSYVPQTLTSSSTFSAKPIETNLDSLATWSINVGDYSSGHGNIKNNKSIPATKFRPGSMTRIFESEYQGTANYIAWASGGAGSNTEPWYAGLYALGYDVPGTGVDFYLRETVGAGMAYFSTTVNFVKTKEKSFTTSANNISNVAFRWRLVPVLDGTASPVVLRGGGPGSEITWYMTNPTPGVSVGLTARGFCLTIGTYNQTPLAKGKHTYFARLNTAGPIVNRTSSSADTNLFNHMKGNAPKSSVTVYYR